MFKSFLGELSNVRVEEHSAGEEVYSNASSADVTETEEHVTVHAKREPLPWSLRGPSYNKPLPGIQGSPMPGGMPPPPMSESSSRSPRITPRAGSPFDQGEGQAIFGSPRSEVPIDSASLISTISSVSSVSSVPLVSAHDALIDETSPPVLGRPLSGFAQEPIIVEAPFVAVSIPTTFTPLVSIPSSPMGHDYAVSPVGLGSGSDSIRENSVTSPVEQDIPLGPVEQEVSLGPVNQEDVPLGPVEQEDSISMIRHNYEISPTSAVSPLGQQYTPTLAVLPIIAIQSPMSAEHERSPYVSLVHTPEIVPDQPQNKVSPLDLSAALDSTNGTVSPTPSLTLNELSSTSPAPSLHALEEGRSPGSLQNITTVLGDKRGHSPFDSPSEHATKLPKLALLDRKESEILYRHYCNDWRVERKYRSERFYFPQLFNAARLQYVHIVRKRKGIPREYRTVAEDVDPGAMYRRDWQVQRQYHIHRYFDPQLFDEGHLRRVKIPMTRHQKKRHFKRRMAAVGITDYTSPGAKLRLNWTVSRRHPVEHYFEAQLFDSVIPASDRLRQDWYTLRNNNLAVYHNGDLLDLSYVNRRQKKDQPMLKRLRSHIPARYPKRIKPHYDNLGQKYRDDWKVKRENNVYLYFDPSLFDEAKAKNEAAYWHRRISELLHRNVPSDKLEEERRAAEKQEMERFLLASLEADRIMAEQNGNKLCLQTQPEAQKLPKEQATTEATQGRDSSIFTLIDSLQRNNGNVDENDRQYDWQFWRDLFGDQSIDYETRDEILHHIRDPQYAGVPTELRPALWLLASGATTSANMDGEYEMLQGMPCSHEDSISADVWKEMESRGLSAEQATSLHSLLSAHCNRDPECGYSPALASIGATLIENVSETDAFCLLIMVMQIQDHRRYLQPSLGGTSLLEFQFENLLLDLDPEIQMHLGHFDVDSTMYCKDFYATLGAPMGSEIHSQILDLFFLEGYPAIHRLALLATIENRDRVLKADGFVSIMEILLGDLTMAHEDWAARDWIVQSCTLFISDEELEELYQNYRMHGRILHEHQILRDLSLIEGEHDQILYTFWWLVQEVKRISLSREAFASQLYETDHNFRVLLSDKYDVVHRIHELEQQLATNQHNHNLEIKQLTSLLSSDCSHPLQNTHIKESSQSYSIPTLQRGNEKIFKI